MMLDLNSDKSIYIQIAETIENEILIGNLREGEQAPSTNQFSKVYKINPATAGKGLNILVEDEILYKRRGIGMFVAEGAKDKILKKRQEVFFKEAIPELIKEAERLEVKKNDIIKVIEDYIGGEE
ncbi:GntR family transcriptional regulator [Clostridium sp. MSJ-4]|uniref:GntR family transcriptional regulator n=2 Tax=Clostridium simiarum TaxID=2841506 RepID=A0ABS6F478_9CLOT|nr:GntR family transcriptional regulator [Clostridium simiarum]MBU5593278.1 GntR family transcriptional regulator [Clostridium simiarum]